MAILELFEINMTKNLKILIGANSDIRPLGYKMKLGLIAARMKL